LAKKGTIWTITIIMRVCDFMNGKNGALGPAYWLIRSSLLKEVSRVDISTFRPIPPWPKFEMFRHVIGSI
jgi:hypothetical protein